MQINILPPGIFASRGDLCRDFKETPKTGQGEIGGKFADLSKIRMGIIAALSALSALYCVYSTAAKADSGGVGTQRFEQTSTATGNAEKMLAAKEAQEAAKLRESAQEERQRLATDKAELNELDKEVAGVCAELADHLRKGGSSRGFEKYIKACNL